MPVRSVNSLMYFCRLSPRGPLARITSSLVPAYFFQFTLRVCRRKARNAERAGRRGAGQNSTARNPMILHDILP